MLKDKIVVILQKNQNLFLKILFKDKTIKKLQKEDSLLIVVASF